MKKNAPMLNMVYPCSRAGKSVIRQALIAHRTQLKLLARDAENTPGFNAVNLALYNINQAIERCSIKKWGR